jgi:ubiquinone biosynthesis protein UbiJ
MLIKPIVTGLLETTLNQYLALDEDAPVFLQPLAGKVIALTIQPFNETLYLCPADDRIQILEQYLGEVDTTISGSLTALGLTLIAPDSNSADKIRIEGDTHTGHKFQQLFKQLDIDLEEKLAQLTGDVLAHKIGRLFRSGRDWTRESIETFQRNLEEFLQEETRDLPAPAEAEIFYQQVDDLRNDVERLQARIDKLVNTAPPDQPS